MGFFDSLETIEQYRASRSYEARTQTLALYVDEVLWHRVMEARPWNEDERPLVYAVYLRRTPHRQFQLTDICPTASVAIAKADDLLDRARAGGFPNAEWTMRAYASADDALDSLPASAGHAHAGLSTPPG